jgi:hypothetical protein
MISSNHGPRDATKLVISTEDPRWRGARIDFQDIPRPRELSVGEFPFTKTLEDGMVVYECTIS